ncbi:MAG: cytochrome b [Thiogranum sp.]
MTLRNTMMDYGSVAKLLHWFTALLFLAAYCAVYYRHWFTVEKTPPNIAALQLHLSFGISIAVFVLLRVVWRLSNSVPSEPAGTPLEHFAAKAGHLLLYFFMITMPITGYIGTGIATQYFYMFDIPKFEDTVLFQWMVVDTFGMTFKEFENPVDFFHKDIGGALLVWLLILVHICAAFFHHFHKKDEVLIRMLPKIFVKRKT